VAHICVIGVRIDFMDQDMRRVLDEVHALAKDNHKMLRAIRRDQWFGFIGKILFWIIMIGVPLYVYQQYLQPIVSQFSATQGTTTTGLQKLINLVPVGK